MSGEPLKFCPTCDRLMSNYSAAAERRSPGALALLEKYDAHRLKSHGNKGRPVRS